MVKLRIGDINNIERKFIPTKKEFFEQYISSLKQIEEYELIQTFKDKYKYRCYNDHGIKKYTRNEKIGDITKVIEIDEETFNKVIDENKKFIKKIRKYYIDGDFEIDVDYFSSPIDIILVEVASLNDRDLSLYVPPKGFLEVTGNNIYENKNIYNGSIISNIGIIEGTDGVGKTVTIENLLKEGIICQDRCMDVISKNMLFEIPMDERANIYEEYLKEINKKIIFLVNNDKEELERRIGSRDVLSEFDSEAYRYNMLYQDTYFYMQERNMLHDKMYLADVTNLTIDEQVEKVKKIILNK